MKVQDIWTRYDESQQFLESRKKRQVKQIALLNNLRRNDEDIASTLLLTLFNRIMSNLYDDKMQVRFAPAEAIDQRTVLTLDILAQNDYREMDKEKLDYDWTWDTLFFGRGYMETLRFDEKRKIMQPCVINPLTLGYDPYIEDEQSWRYYWKWITRNKWELLQLYKSKQLNVHPDNIPSGIEPLLWEYKVKREEAKQAQPQANDVRTGDVYQILEFYGYNDSGEKAVYWVDKNFSQILYYEKLDLKDGPKGTSLWPIVKKEVFREPHSTVNFSVADLLEDKHRARSVLLNLAFTAAKDKANPLYGYNPSKIKDLSQLFSRQIQQHIPMDSPDAMWPLNTANPMDPGLMAFMQLLNQEANEPMGTGIALQQGKKGKSATESAIQQQLNDLAQSLQSKVLQFGEKEFWGQWYQRYLRLTKAGDEKIATIVGVKGITFETIKFEEIRTKYPPRVMIFSAKEAEYKELVERRDLMQMYGQFQSSLTPDGMRNFNKFVFFPKFLKDPTLIDVIVPKTLDEIKAEQENDQINDGTLPVVGDTDNHEQHIFVHYMAKNTWAKWVHIQWHEEMLGMQKKMQEQQMQEEAQGGGKDGGKPNDAGGGDVGAQKKDAKESAAPLKAELSGKESKAKLK